MPSPTNSAWRRFAWPSVLTAVLSATFYMGANKIADIFLEDVLREIRRLNTIVTSVSAQTSSLSAIDANLQREIDVNREMIRENREALRDCKK